MNLIVEYSKLLSSELKNIEESRRTRRTRRRKKKKKKTSNPRVLKFIMARRYRG